MRVSESHSGVVLDGLDGSNPLGFLAAVGIAAVAHTEFPCLRVGWKQTGYGWRPAIWGIGEDRGEFSQTLFQILKCTPMTVFEIDDRMPFDASKFSCELQHSQTTSSIADRRNADLLVGIGTELYPDKKSGHFQDSKLRMVRSGDSKKHGLPYYAKSYQDELTLEHLQRALFCVWDYRDMSYSLRLDPTEDQRYALRWRDPSASNKKDKFGTMLAANCLAIEAMACFPTLMDGRQAQTTGFHQIGRETWFAWPIWTPMISIDVMCSLLASPDFGKDRAILIRRGIEEVYRSQRIRQNQYYSNFSPAQPFL